MRSSAKQQQNSTPRESVRVGSLLSLIEDKGAESSSSELSISSQHVNELLTFEDPSLLRGSPLASVLHRGAGIMQNSEGSAKTYQMSGPVDVLDGFVSHNWSMPRWKKFLILAFFFNLQKAAIATIGVMVCCVVLQGVLRNHGLLIAWGSLCSLPVFLLVLLLSHEAAAWVGYRGPNLFLDKTCIHQTDTSLKRRGIEKLGAFLHNSNRIIICYSELYLRKLWTVFEVASFLIVHPVTSMHVVPTFYPFFVICLGILVWLGGGVIDTLFYSTSNSESFCNNESEEGSDTILAIGSMLMVLQLLVTLVLFRRWARERALLHDAVSNFSVKNALAFDEADRPVVEGSIIDYMRCFGFVKESASDAEALQAFDALVKQAVPQAFLASFGRYGIPLRHVLIAILCEFARVAERVLATLQHGCGLRKAVAVLLKDLLVKVHFWPSIIPIMTACAEKRIRLRGLAECLYLVCVLLLLMMVYFVWGAIVYVLFLPTYSEGSSIMMVILALTTFLWLGAISWAYRPLRQKAFSISLPSIAEQPSSRPSQTESLTTSFGSADEMYCRTGNCGSTGAAFKGMVPLVIDQFQVQEERLEVLDPHASTHVSPGKKFS